MNEHLRILVDPEDKHWLDEYSFWLVSNGYPATNIDGVQVYLHKLIMPHDGPVDHINGDILDCRKINLRRTNNKKNCWNQKVSIDSTTGYKGVTLHTSGKYRARIMVHDIRFHIGMFTTAKEAAIAYNKEAILLYGEFAKLNTVEN